MATMTESSGPTRSWQAGLAAGLAIVTCYGTAAVVALLAALGVSVALNQRLWAGLIVLFTIMALIALARSYWRHRRIGPLALAVAGAMVILWVMYGPYSARRQRS
jgi:arsenite methyltransferase